MRRNQTRLKPHHLAVGLLALITTTLPVSADIFEWEYIDPLQPELGKQESTTLVPDGAGVDAVPGVDLSGLNLTNAYLPGRNLTGAIVRNAFLNNADLSGTELSSVFFGTVNLTGVDFSGASLISATITSSSLTGADFTDAIVMNASFVNATASGLTEQMLASTASYQTGNLKGIRFKGNDLSGWNLMGKDLAGADFNNAVLTGTDFTDAIVTNANFESTTDDGFTEQQLASTANYQVGDLVGIGLRNNDLSGWDLSGFDLTRADFGGAILTGTDLTDVVIAGASFNGTTDRGFSMAVLSSTASYQAGYLPGISLFSNDLSGWDLSGLNLINGAFRQAILTNSDLSFSDIRGTLVSSSQVNSAADKRNLIREDGRILDGLLVNDSESIRIYDSDKEEFTAGLPVSIIVHDGFVIDSGATLRFIIEDPDWGSTILFDASVGTANLAGTLELAMKLDDGLTPADLLGATFQLFDWSGVSIVGDFDAFVLDSAWYAAGLSIDRSQLMTTGEVHVVPLIGDLDGDNFVGIADLNIVLAGWNQSVTPGDLLAGDVDGDGFIGIVDLNLILGTWNAAVPPVVGIGNIVPEPGAAILLVLGGPAVLRRRARLI